MRLSFTVPGRPVPYQRPGQTIDGRRFTERESAEFMSRVARAARIAMVSQPWPRQTIEISKRGPVVRGPKGQFELTIIVYRAERRGDATNFAKGVEDALTKACVWWDDAMVVDQHAHLREDRENPRTEIMITMKGASE